MQRGKSPRDPKCQDASHEVRTDLFSASHSRYVALKLKSAIPPYKGEQTADKASEINQWVFHAMCRLHFSQRYITSLLLQMSQAFQALSRIQTPSNATHQPDALLGRYRLRVTSSMSIMLHALIQRLCLSTKSGVKHAESQISYRYIINY